MNTCFRPGHIELSFPSELGYEVIARDAVASFARKMGFEKERIDDVKTALSEACINAIEHGNMMKAQLRIDIICTFDGNQLLVEVHDQGLQAFAPVTKPLSIEQKVAGLGPLRGMGLLLMMQLADEANCITNERGGNCFRLTWYKDSSAVIRQS